MRIEAKLKAMTPFLTTVLIITSLVNAESFKNDTVIIFHPVEPNQVPKVLRMISEATRCNYECIRTWEGREFVSANYYIHDEIRAEEIFNQNTNDSGPKPKKITERVKETIEFSIDVEKDLIYVNRYQKEPAQYIDLETGRKLVPKGIAGRVKTILTPEFQIDCTRHTMRDGVALSHRAVKQVRLKGSECVSNMHPIYDPKDLFGRPKCWETMDYILNYMEKQGTFDINIDGYELKLEMREIENAIEYRIQQPLKGSTTQEKLSPEYYMLVTTVFSEQKGYNRILCEIEDGRGRKYSKEEWDYELVNGIYLPIKTAKRNFRPDTVKLSFEEVSSVQNYKITQPIPAEVFTYKNLGLKNGDKFIDKILDKEYTYQDENLVEVEKKSK